jgi:preprotein translocase subunit SecF
MEPPTEVEVDEVEEVWEIEDVPARRFGSSRDHVKIQSATETQRHRVKKQEKKLNAENTEESAEGNGNFRRSVSTSLCASVTLRQIFLPLRGCEEFPIIAGAR